MLESQLCSAKCQYLPSQAVITEARTSIIDADFIDSPSGEAGCQSPEGGLRVIMVCGKECRQGLERESGSRVESR